MTVQMCLFDFDGTLADTLPLCISSLQTALETATGRAYLPHEIVAHFGISEEGILRRLAPEASEGCEAIFLSAYHAGHVDVHPLPGIEEMLDELLNAGLQLGLVTGKGEASARISLSHLGLERYFHAIEVGSPEKNVKAERITHLLAQAGTGPEHAVYIGDTPSDMISAREAKVIPLGAAWFETADAEELHRHGAHEVFTTPAALVRWLRAHMG